MRRKADLPSKTCLYCQRPFSWRKKWARAWPEIRFCSQACKQAYKQGANARAPE
ncbi:hypothetical protein C84B14_17013 [Salinisphaera sp. C84B14]|uniref:DUF2256 domain-containing protein n=1 Tax=Salinisphaera sp. C84B14 TaxID=1304155 RepID=UPI0032B286F6|tara:strand:- start:721 stop:882 length:162 start_codon:yes stop_codon:yes gene_type:complete